MYDLIIKLIFLWRGWGKFQPIPTLSYLNYYRNVLLPDQEKKSTML